MQECLFIHQDIISQESVSHKKQPKMIRKIHRTNSIISAYATIIVRTDLDSIKVEYYPQLANYWHTNLKTQRS